MLLINFAVGQMLTTNLLMAQFLICGQTLLFQTLPVIRQWIVPIRCIVKAIDLSLIRLKMQRLLLNIKLDLFLKLH